MIVRMKKVTLLVSDKERKNVLKDLRTLGTVHIKNIRKPESNELVKVKEDLFHTKKAIEALESYTKKKEGEKIFLKPFEISKQLEEIKDILNEKGHVERNLQDYGDHVAWFKPWGAFDPSDIEELKKKGVYIKLYYIASGEFKKLKNKNLHIIKKNGNYLYCVLASKNPKESQLNSVEGRLKAKTPLLDSIKSYLQEAEKKHVFLNVMHGMEKEKNFSYLQGFCPVDKIKHIVALSKEKEFGYLIEEPGEAKNIPTLIQTPRWVRIISPVFKFMNIVPGYNEYDISIWFLIFFSMFFAMLISDAGYGLLFIALTFLAKHKLKKIPAEPFKLMYVLSFTTLIWGAITGNWFGAEKIAQIPFLNLMVVEKINSFVNTNQNFMIYVCFVIGVIQLTIAHLVIAIRKINSLKALSEIGWVTILWGLFFTAGTLVIGKPFPYFATYLFIVGAVLIILFSNSEKGLLKGIAFSLGDLPLKIVSSFADIVSYIRLFAVGYASTVLAVTFNNLAFEIGFNNIISGLVGALILFLGHTLNIALGFMAVIVHGVRLNMLEFSGQMSMEWSGNEYKPFNEESVV